MNADRGEAHMRDYICGELHQREKSPRKDADWGHLVCKTSRAAHMRVWQELPQRAVVTELVALFEVLLAKMQKISDKGEDVAMYMENVGKRRDSCLNYLQGVPPLLPKKGSKEEERLVAHMAELAERGICMWPPDDDGGGANTAGVSVSQKQRG